MNDQPEQNHLFRVSNRHSPAMGTPPQIDADVRGRYRTQLVQDRVREINRVQIDTTNAIVRLDAIPCVSTQTAQIILAELGTDMSRFPTAKHAAAWAGLAPSKDESAGRNRSSKVRDGNQHLKVALIQSAHAISHMKDTYLSAQFRRLAARRGRKRAAVAVAHSILVIAYHLLKRGTEYVDLGGDYFDRRNEQYLQRNLVNRLERLELKVTVEPVLSVS